MFAGRKVKVNPGTDFDYEKLTCRSALKVFSIRFCFLKPIFLEEILRK
jgi:hypothetical protein